MSRTALIVKLAAIGDVVMALPMLSALRAQDAHVAVDWLCGHAVAPLLRHVAGVREVVPIDEAALLAGSPARKAAAVAHAWRALAGRRYDTVYIAHSDARYRLLARSVRAGERRWLGARSPRPGLLPGRRHTDEYVRLVTGVEGPGAPAYPAPDLDVELDAGLAADLARANPAQRPQVALTPGGARNAARENALRRWPLARYVELAARLHASGYAVLVTGDGGDAWARAAFAGTPIVDLIGRTDLPQLVAVYRRCAAVVAHDSGPMHLARLAGTRVVALLGPTPPSMFFRPQDGVRVLWPGAALACAPCYDGREFAACSDNRCMQMIDCDAVLREITGAR